jgi:hypothetical protein
MPKGVKIEDVVTGSGRIAERGLTVVIKLRLFLSRGEEIFAEHLKDRTIIIDLGKRDEMAGVRKGIEGMRVGGHRRLVISPHLAYGAEGRGDVVPPNAVLHADVELIEVREPGERKPEDRPGKSLHIFRPGEAVRSIARLQFDLHESGSCGGFITTPVPGYGWRPARSRHIPLQPDMGTVRELFDEAMLMPEVHPQDCIAHDDLWSDSSEPANGITRDQATDTLCISTTVDEMGQHLRHYSMKETSEAWLASKMCRTLSELMESHSQ